MGRKGAKPHVTHTKMGDAVRLDFYKVVNGKKRRCRTVLLDASDKERIRETITRVLAEERAKLPKQRKQANGDSG